MPALIADPTPLLRTHNHATAHTSSPTPPPLCASPTKSSLFRRMHPPIHAIAIPCSRTHLPQNSKIRGRTRVWRHIKKKKKEKKGKHAQPPPSLACGGSGGCGPRKPPPTALAVYRDSHDHELKARLTLPSAVRHSLTPVPTQELWSKIKQTLCSLQSEARSISQSEGGSGNLPG